MSTEDAPITFRKFLEDSSNLLTIYGIFNALIIYCVSISNEAVKITTVSSFFLLSLLVWFELLSDTQKKLNGGWKFIVFFFLIGLIQFMQLYLFIISQQKFIYLVVKVSTGIGNGSVIFLLLIRIIKSTVSLTGRVKNIIYIAALLFSTCLTGLILIFMMPTFDKWLKPEFPKEVLPTK